MRCSMDENDMDVERTQNSDIEEEIGKVIVCDDGAIDSDDESPFAEARDVAEDSP